MKVLGVAHSSYTVTDLDKSLAFYRDDLGMEEVSQFEASGPMVETIIGIPEAHLKVAFLAVGGHTLELIQYLSPKGASYDRRTCDVGPCHIALLVDDINEAYSNLAAKRLHRHILMPRLQHRGCRGVYREALQAPCNNHERNTAYAAERKVA